MGTSLILEVDVDSSSDDEAINLEDAGKVKPEDNILNKLMTLEDPDLKDEAYKDRVKIVGLTHTQINLRRRAYMSSKVMQNIPTMDDLKNEKLKGEDQNN